MRSRAFAALFLFSGAGLSAEKLPVDVFQDFVAAKVATMRGSASEADVDRLLSYYTDDIVYEDPKVNVRIEGKGPMRAGMLSHIADYAGSAKETKILVSRRISVANTVAAAITEVFWVQAASGRQEIRRKRLNVAEFRGDKICHLIDYH